MTPTLFVYRRDCALRAPHALDKIVRLNIEGIRDLFQQRKRCRRCSFLNLGNHRRAAPRQLRQLFLRQLAVAAEDLDPTLLTREQRAGHLDR
jgi:hypothetical protein